MNIGELKDFLQDLLQMKNTMTETFAMTTQYETTEDQMANARMLEWHEFVEQF